MNESQIFTNALKFATPGERVAFLDEVCAGNADLRAGVEALLAAHAVAPDFLEKPAGSLAGTIDVPSGSEGAPTNNGAMETPGQLIAGKYKLLEEIGEGGMGTVWMAQQIEPVKRLVAIKLIKPGMDSKQVLARFEAERQALALMDHPNIARVFDAGAVSEVRGQRSEVRSQRSEVRGQRSEVGEDFLTSDLRPLTSGARPYFVMELVKGIPITKYCDEHHLTPRQRLELFIPVCQAIQHAHQKGIIHRDIKPSNVLVAMYDDRPVPKVIDFGVAKATGVQLTEATLHTNFGAVVGTIEYMSPEQASFNQLDVDTRSDIYSLGVLLYELLAGSPPFTKKELEKAGMLEMLRVIREQEPSKPSTKLSSSDALPSLSASRGTEPSRLTKLVRGELDWIVMKALEKDRSRRYETANGFAIDVQRYLADEPVQACPPSTAYRFKKFVRRNKGPVLAASTIFAMLLLLVIGLAHSNRLIADERNQKANALAEKEQALVQKQLALDRAEAERQRAARNFLKARIALVAILSEAGFGFGEWNNMPPSLRRRFSQGTINFYHSLLEEQGTDPSLQYEKAVAYRDLSRVHRSWKEFQEAEKFIRESIAILDGLVTEYPERHEYCHQLAFSHYILGSVLPVANRPAEAEAALQRAIDLYEKMIISKVPYDILGTGLIECYAPLISLQKKRGALKDAERTAGRLGQLPVHVSQHSAFASMLYTQGLIDEARKQYQEAIRQHETATRLKADDPLTLNSFAWLLATCPVTQLRDAERAVELAGKAVRLAPTERSYWNTLGAARYLTGDWRAAIDALEKSMDLGKGGDSNDWFFLAKAHWQLGEKGKAREYFDRAVQWMDKHLERGHGLPQGRELYRFRAEAAELLGVEQKKG